MKRTRTRSVRCESGVNWIATSRPASGHDASAKARSTARTSAPQAGTPRSWNGAARLVPSGASRRRADGIGGADLAGPVDDEDAVFHLLDHEPVELRLLARQLEAAARAQLLAREPAGELAGEHGDDEEAAAGQAGLRHQQRRRRRRATRTPSHAVPSSASVATAAVASARTRGVSTPAMSTGRTSRAT